MCLYRYLFKYVCFFLSHKFIIVLKFSEVAEVLELPWLLHVLLLHVLYCFGCAYIGINLCMYLFVSQIHACIKVIGGS